MPVSLVAVRAPYLLLFSGVQAAVWGWLYTQTQSPRMMRGFTSHYHASKGFVEPSLAHSPDDWRFVVLYCSGELGPN
ncbi:uncharacterized protein LAESUDRAFT_719104 [Laetiporus sulphureus 93-53]|uniref:Uncharacterized protein n=1 Tax=Laetiporus sulphureus 93-53 TaxID=1314785 RepID=A0A165IA73_9APHY|nr:uncharacterized protein LAESUDRAFT_719104 [Laetiporus sulphureus 93-53]KZT12795.1 hypothetical protein LAESUDRAFT_719104 [Laetiporus sulphureus 93-53]